MYIVTPVSNIWTCHSPCDCLTFHLCFGCYSWRDILSVTAWCVTSGPWPGCYTWGYSVTSQLWPRLQRYLSTLSLTPLGQGKRMHTRVLGFVTPDTCYRHVTLTLPISVRFFLTLNPVDFVKPAICNYLVLILNVNGEFGPETVRRCRNKTHGTISD